MFSCRAGGIRRPPRLASARPREFPARSSGGRRLHSHDHPTPPS
jgi:hypothetical protein